MILMLTNNARIISAIFGLATVIQSQKSSMSNQKETSITHLMEDIKEEVNFTDPKIPLLRCCYSNLIYKQFFYTCPIWDAEFDERETSQDNPTVYSLKTNQIIDDASSRIELTSGTI